MNDINELAAKLLDTKGRRDEKERYVNYKIPAQLKEMQKNVSNVDDRIRLAKFEEECKVHTDILSGLETEVKDIEDDLKPLLIKFNATRLDPLRIHVQGDTYFDTFYEDGEVISSGKYTMVR